MTKLFTNLLLNLDKSGLLKKGRPLPGIHRHIELRSECTVRGRLRMGRQDTRRVAGVTAIISPGHVGSARPIKSRTGLVALLA
ncbi:hypothetical protein ElyMa_004898700 [Elysia marginata]|uniref:Uncharacterized protein n=1 Tax=Elysia marginata TaxID=1093978 RepID=A0AAV4IXW8_9GAST|nr:hypothetical protein ElyMa_004898700 [Elysia marginata]